MSAETQGSRRVERAIQWGALALGVALFCGALYYINFRLAAGIIRRLGPALPIALVFSGLWHLARTWAWAYCFPPPAHGQLRAPHPRSSRRRSFQLSHAPRHCR